MNIEYKSYLIKQSENSDRFHLCKKVIRVKESTGKKYEDLKDLGYDMTLESCINSIASLELRDKKKTVSLKEFLIEYKKEKQELLNVIN